jgi:predicted PurR-regulated permease PerM
LGFPGESDGYRAREVREEGTPLLPTHARLFQQRGPDRRAASTLVADSSPLTIVGYAAAAFLTALITGLLVVGKDIFKPLIIAILVWHLINGVFNALTSLSQRIRIRGRVLPAPVRLVVALSLVLVVGWLFVHVMVDNIGQVVARAPVYEQNLRNAANVVNGWLGLEELTAEQPLLERGRLTGMARGVARSMTGVFGSGGTVAVFVLFLLLEQQIFNRKITMLCLSPDREGRVRRMLQQIGREIQSYLWLKTLMGLLVTGLSYVVMKGVGVDLAEFWAVLIFALSYIPYFGAWLGVLFPTILCLVQFDTLTPFLITAGLLSLTQFVCGSILEPRIMGKGLNISPLIMLLALSVWGAMWGIVGMFLAVPVMVVVMIVCSHFEATRKLAIILSADGSVRT